MCQPSIVLSTSADHDPLPQNRFHNDDEEQKHGQSWRYQGRSHPAAGRTRAPGVQSGVSRTGVCLVLGPRHLSHPAVHRRSARTPAPLPGNGTSGHPCRLSDRFPRQSDLRHAETRIADRRGSGGFCPGARLDPGHAQHRIHRLSAISKRVTKHAAKHRSRTAAATHAGCEHVDVAEQLAIERAKSLFGAEYVNVQPHSGSQANQAVYLAVLKPGDTILGMSLAHGGHLTHGAAVNLSGKLFNAVAYGLDANERIDYDQVGQLAAQHRPQMIVAGASAYNRVSDWRRFREIADRHGAWLMVDMAHYAGLVAAGLYPSPVGIADFVTTTTHKTLRGPRGGLILAGAQHGNALHSSIFPSIQGGPLMHVIAAKAMAFQEALQPGFRQYQQQVLDNAKTLAETLVERGLRVVSGRTESHRFLVDLRARKTTGKDAEGPLA